MSRLVALAALALSSAIPAQEPILHASEVAGWRHLRAWLGQAANWQPAYVQRQLGYEQFIFGKDKHGEPFRSHTADDTFASPAELDPQHTAVMVLQPMRDNWQPNRRLYITRTGRLFVAASAAKDAATSSPSIATLAAVGVDPVLDNLLLQSGEAQDGTHWLRIDERLAAVERQQRVDIAVGTGTVERLRVRIGIGRLPWHPAWRPLTGMDVVSMDAETQPNGPDLVAHDRGVPARGLHLHLEHGDRAAVLSADDVALRNGVLHVTLRPGAFVASEQLDDQAWMAQAMRLFASSQADARAKVKLDRDKDGAGEYGTPDEVLPGPWRRYNTRADGLLQFRKHLVAVHLPADADGAEQRFAAYAWPEAAGGQRDLAFAVDQRGTVFVCRAHGRFAGKKAPAADALADAALGWRPID